MKPFAVSLLLGLAACTPPPSLSTETLVLVRPLHVADRTVVLSLDGNAWARGAVRAPNRVGGAARIEADGAWLEVSADGLEDDARAPSVTGDTLVFAHAVPATDVVFVAGKDSFEDLRVLRNARAPTTARYRLRPSANLAVRLREGRVEAIDPDGHVRISSAPAFALDAAGRRRDATVSLDGEVLSVAIDTTGLAYPIVVDPSWSTVAPLKDARFAAATVRLADGRVLAAGGHPTLKTAEVYDPKLGTWTSVGPTAETHQYPLAVRLGSGKVIVAGATTFTAELFDPTTATFGSTGSLSASHQFGAIALLGSGKVLVAGGFNDGSDVGELYDPAAGTWSKTPPMVAHRDGPGGVLLASGKFLLAGGYDSGGTMLSSAEIYDPSANTWTAAASMGTPRRLMAIALLPTGRVLVAGGGDAVSPLSTTEVYDPAANTWTAASPMSVARSFVKATTLTSGRVLVAGGLRPFTTVYSTAELFDGTSFSNAGALTGARFDHGQTLLADGKVLLSGGQTLSTPLSTVELFAFSGPGEACSSGAGCISGICVDGTCCDTSCTGACDACDLAGSLGTCSKVSSGAPHGPRSCGAYAKCVAGVCATTCGADSDCATGNYCGGSACVPKKAAGVACTASTQCSSGACVDGVCCDTACTGQCQACDVVGKVGTCSVVAGATHGTRTTCGGVGAGTACGARCDGIDGAACHLPGTSTACGVDACATGVETKVGTCDGAGKCPDTSTSCGAYACGATACKKACATKADCAAGYLCSGTTCVPVPGLGEACTDPSGCTSGFCTDGVCCGVASCGAGSSCAVGKKGVCAKVDGTACAASAECGSPSCVDGVCCDRACDGQCEACDVSGKTGVCTPVAGDPHKGRAACNDGAGDACKRRTCNGALDPKSCVAYANGPTTVCRPAACLGADLAPAGTCDGAGACTTPKSVSCSPYRCAAGACRTTCASKDDCADGFECAGGLCKPNGGTCSPDRTSSTAPDGTVSVCAPYRCRTDGKCGDACAASSDCASDALCDVALGTCVPQAAEQASGGCVFGRRPIAALPTLALLVLAVFGRGRRRR